MSSLWAGTFSGTELLGEQGVNAQKRCDIFGFVPENKRLPALPQQPVSCFCPHFGFGTMSSWLPSITLWGTLAKQHGEQKSSLHRCFEPKCAFLEGRGRGGRGYKGFSEIYIGPYLHRLYAIFQAWSVGIAAKEPWCRVVTRHHCGACRKRCVSFSDPHSTVDVELSFRILILLQSLIQEERQ